MIIAFNLLSFSELSGLQIYTANFLRHYHPVPGDKLIIFGTKKTRGLFPNLPATVQIKIIKFLVLNRLSITLYQQLFFPFSLNKARVDLLVCPSLSLPLWWRKKLVIIHDLAFLRFAEESKGLFRLYLKLALWSAKYWSLKIATISDFSRHEISTFLKIDAASIPLLPFGRPELSSRPSEDKEKSILKKFNLLAANGQTKKYFIYLGGGYYRKNLERLGRAFNELLKLTPDYELLIAGRLDSGLKKLKLEFSQKPEFELLKNHLIFSGEVSESEKTALLKNALALTFVSLYEGFGIPPLEAQAAGSPVLAGRGSALEEICGTGAYFINPLNFQEIKNGLIFLSQPSNARQDLIKRGNINLSRFSWVKTSETFQNLLRNLKN